MGATSTSSEKIYTTVLDGQVIRGTLEEIQQAIADWRENHD